MASNTVELSIANWDDTCHADFLCGRGINIKSQPYTKKNKKNEKNIDGSHSPKFCSDWDDEDAFEDRYSCECKDTKGRIFSGELCAKCRTKVESREVDIKKTGWVIMDDYQIIHPGYYKMLRTFIGDATLTDILTFDKDVSIDGELKDKPFTSIFKGIGLYEFYLRYEEILVHFKGTPRNKNKKDKTSIYRTLMSSKRSVFASSIPIYTPVLRPVAFKGESLFYNPVDKRFNYILSLVVLLNRKVQGSALSRYSKKRQRMDIPAILHTLQKKLIEYYDTIFIEVNQKDGHVKDSILGGRVNYSARNVIIPDPLLSANEIRLPYLTFLELFKYELLSHLCKIDNVTIAVANQTWSKARLIFSNKVYEIMKYMLKKFKLKVLINRNPSLNYGSILCMKIADIKSDMNDYTMSLPIQVLTVLNADLKKSGAIVILHIESGERLTSGVGRNIAC